MLSLPDSGFQPSVTVHNVRLDVLVDWIEASIVFIDAKLSQNDVVDSLCENGIYREQDFAIERVGDAWTELERRSESLGNRAGFVVDGRRIRRMVEWSECPPYSFCVLLTSQILLKKWARQFGTDFTEQGDLFEQITAECLEDLGWTVFRTGWATGNSVKIKQVVEDVSTHIREPEIPGQVEKWLSEHGNDEQLDVVCSDPFYDGWGGRPLYFFQCASGANWPDKLQTPDPGSWQRVINFTNIPQRGFAMPFALLENDFRKRAGRINGMLLDRFRLQTPACDGTADWISKTLSRKLVKWMRPRVKKLPDERT